jgi:hypothetical protein
MFKKGSYTVCFTTSKVRALALSLLNLFLTKEGIFGPLLSVILLAHTHYD